MRQEEKGVLAPNPTDFFGFACMGVKYGGGAVAVLKLDEVGERPARTKARGALCRDIRHYLTAK